MRTSVDVEARRCDNTSIADSGGELIDGTNERATTNAV
jgi:hypothetical protein